MLFGIPLSVLTFIAGLTLTFFVKGINTTELCFGVVIVFVGATFSLAMYNTWMLVLEIIRDRYVKKKRRIGAENQLHSMIKFRRCLDSLMRPLTIEMNAMRSNTISANRSEIGRSEEIIRHEPDKPE